MSVFGIVEVAGAISALDTDSTVFTDSAPSTSYKTAKTRRVTPAAGEIVEITRLEGDVAGDADALDPCEATLGYAATHEGGAMGATTSLGSSALAPGDLDCTGAVYAAAAGNVAIRGSAGKYVDVHFRLKWSGSGAPSSLCTRNNVVRGRTVRLLPTMFAGHMRGAF